MRLRYKEPHNRIKREKIILKDNNKHIFRWQMFFTQMLPGLLLMLGADGILCCFVPAGMSRWLLFWINLALYVILILIRSFGWFSGRTWGMTAVSLAVTVIVSPIGCYRGLLYFSNQWIEIYNKKTSGYIQLFSLSECTVSERIQFLIVVGFLCAGTAVWLGYAGGRLWGTLYAAALMLLAAAAGLQVSAAVSGALMMGWLGIWCKEAVSGQTIKKQGTTVLLMLAVLLGASAAALALSPEGQVSSLRRQIADNISHIRYGIDTLPEGDMVKASVLVGDTAQTTLEITSDSDFQNMYFKGFTGSVFDGVRWLTLDKSVYYEDNAGMLSWLEENDFDTVYQYFKYQQMIEYGNEKMQTVRIINNGANRHYVYTPYTAGEILQGSGNVYMSYDDQLMSSGLFGSTKYSFSGINDTLLTDSIVHSPFKENEEAAQFERTEGVYRSFVYSDYLEVTESEKQYLQTVFYNDEDWSERTLAVITQQIRTVFQGQVTYSPDPQVYTGHEDFLTWFLGGHSTGNAAYYATAAVLAYRTAGIPARYAEGYYLSSAGAYSLNTSEIGTAQLTAQNAHAWVEIYIDNAGWMPVEVAPGFYSAAYSLQNVVGMPQSSVNIQDQQEDSRLNGTTADTLERQSETADSLEETLKQALRIAGVFVLFLLLIWMIRMVFIIIYYFRRRTYEQCIKRADCVNGCRMLYAQVIKVLGISGHLESAEFPEQNTSVFKEYFEHIEPAEYQRFIFLIQKVVFGEMTLAPDEYASVKFFAERLCKTAYNEAGRKQRMLLKYIYVFC